MKLGIGPLDTAEPLGEVVEGFRERITLSPVLEAVLAKAKQIVVSMPGKRCVRLAGREEEPTLSTRASPISPPVLILGAAFLRGQTFPTCGYSEGAFCLLTASLQVLLGCSDRNPKDKLTCRSELANDFSDTQASSQGQNGWTVFMLSWSVS